MVFRDMFYIFVEISQIRISKSAAPIFRRFINFENFKVRLGRITRRANFIVFETSRAADTSETVRVRRGFLEAVRKEKRCEKSCLIDVKNQTT